MPALLRMQQSQNTAMPSAAPPASAERGISLQTMHMDLELQGHMPVGHTIHVSLCTAMLSRNA